MKQPVYRYKRVTVWPGKHGDGDFRVQFAGGAPSHAELLVMLWWMFEAEDRYHKFGRRMLWWHIKDVYDPQSRTLGDILKDVDGEEPPAADVRQALQKSANSGTLW